MPIDESPRTISFLDRLLSGAKLEQLLRFVDREGFHLTLSGQKSMWVAHLKREGTVTFIGNGQSAHWALANAMTKMLRAETKDVHDYPGAPAKKTRDRERDVLTHEGFEKIAFKSVLVARVKKRAASWPPYNDYLKRQAKRMMNGISYPGTDEGWRDFRIAVARSSSINGGGGLNDVDFYEDLLSDLRGCHDDTNPRLGQVIGYVLELAARDWGEMATPNPEAETVIADPNPRIWHLEIAPGAVYCHANYPNMGITTITTHVTCPACWEAGAV